MSDKPSCTCCAYRQTCNKKFSITDPSKCLEYTRDLRIENEDEKKENNKKED